MLEDLQPAVKVWPCLVRKVLSELDDSDRKLLQQFLDDAEKWPANPLSRALATKNISLSDKIISRHRLKGCSCSKILK
jgi:hypothetical protein